MENRERDRMSQRTTPTEAGEINRRTEEAKGRDEGSGVEFGKNIGRSEDLDANTTGGTMRDDENRNQDSMENESTRRSGGESGYGSMSGSTSGRSGSIGNMGGGGSMDNSDSGSNSRGGSMGNRNSSSGDSSEGRH